MLKKCGVDCIKSIHKNCFYYIFYLLAFKSGSNHVTYKILSYL